MSIACPQPKRTRCFHSILLLLPLMLSGCNDSPYAAVSGVVTLDGTPVANATVGFVPKDDGAGRAAFGQTDDVGHYELSTLKPSDGALPGEYYVTITAVDIIQSEKAQELANEFGSIASDLPQAKPKENWRVPKSYSETESSGLEYVVKPGRNTADWILQSKP